MPRVGGAHGRRDVQHLAAADRDPATDLAQHVAIEHVQHQRPRGADPDEALPARSLEEPDLRLGLGGAGVHHERAAGGDASREPPDRPDRAVERRRRPPRARRGQDVAAFEPIAVGPDEVRGHARDRAGAVLLFLVGLEAADPGALAGRIQLDLLAGLQAVAGERSGRDRPRPLDREDPIHEQPRRARPRATGASAIVRSSAAIRSGTPSPVCDDTATIGEASSAVPATCSRTSSCAMDERLLVDQVAFREGDHPTRHPEDVEDLQVLLRLGLPSLVGRDHEQDEANRPDPGEHVAYEAFVSRHVDEPDLPAAREGAPRVPEIDRESPPLLLGPAIGVDAGEADDQRRLAVIDVPGGGDHAELSGHAQAPSSRTSPSRA